MATRPMSEHHRRPHSHLYVRIQRMPFAGTRKARALTSELVLFECAHCNSLGAPPSDIITPFLLSTFR